MWNCWKLYYNICLNHNFSFLSNLICYQQLFVWLFSFILSLLVNYHEHQNFHTSFHFWKFTGSIILFMKTSSKTNERIPTWINIIIPIINKWNACTKAAFERGDYLKYSFFVVLSIFIKHLNAIRCALVASIAMLCILKCYCFKYSSIEVIPR